MRYLVHTRSFPEGRGIFLVLVPVGKSMWYFEKPKDTLWFLFTLGKTPDQEVTTSLGNKSCAIPHCVPNHLVNIGNETISFCKASSPADRHINKTMTYEVC
jgi:hypothetical protein